MNCNTHPQRPLLSRCECVQRTAELYANEPQTRGVGIRGKLWTPGQTLRIGFVNGTRAQIDTVIRHAATWEAVVNLSFEFYIFDQGGGSTSIPNPETDARVSFRDAVYAGTGSWSAVGTDAEKYPANRPTMHYGWVGEHGEDADRAVILHEFAHMLGMVHEHNHPLRPWEPTEQLYADTASWGWTREEADAQYALRYSYDVTAFNAFDVASITIYWHDASWTSTGVAVAATSKLSAGDVQWGERFYPFEDGGGGDDSGGDDDGDDNGDTGAEDEYLLWLPIVEGGE